MADIPTNLPKEISDKYTIKNDAFVNVAKDNPKDLVVAEIGDTKDLTKFQPQMKICRWGDTPDDNECNVSIRLVHDEKTPVVSTDKEKIVWSGDKIDCNFYDLTEDEGGYEFEVILKEKPKTNIIEFTLQDKDVDYFYQPELTPEEIAQGASRPDNVVGSYAVYAKTPKTNWTGGKEYGCSKVGHIFRPKIIDSAGTEVWGGLNIASGILSITVPQDFLDKAVYPVIVDPTIGFLKIGGSGVIIANGNADQCTRLGYGGALNTPAGSGTVSSFSAALALSGAGNETVGISTFLNTENTATDSHAEVAMVDADKNITSTTASWFTFTAASEAMSSAAYVLSIVGNHNDISGALNIYVNYDSTLPGNVTFTNYNELFQGAGGDTDYTNSQEDPWTETDAVGTSFYSLYVTYTPTAGQSVTEYFIANGTYSWTAPVGVTSISVKAWGGGGAGFGYDSATGGAGGGGGAYATSTVAVTPTTSYNVVVGKGGTSGANRDGTDSSFVGDDKTVLADAGTGATSQTANGVGGTLAGSTGDAEAAGGPGGDGTTDDAGGGGGEAGGPHGTGGTGSNGSTTTGGNGGAGDAGSGGTAGTGGANGVDGGKGGYSLNGGGGGGGGGNGRYGGMGGFPGGGGGGSEYTGAGNSGSNGCIIISYTAPAAGSTSSSTTTTTTTTSSSTTTTTTSSSTSSSTTTTSSSTTTTTTTTSSSTTTTTTTTSTSTTTTSSSTSITGTSTSTSTSTTTTTTSSSTTITTTSSSTTSSTTTTSSSTTITTTSSSTSITTTSSSTSTTITTTSSSTSSSTTTTSSSTTITTTSSSTSSSTTTTSSSTTTTTTSSSSSTTITTTSSSTSSSTSTTTTSSSTTTTTTSSSTSSTTTVTLSPTGGGLAFGEQNPIQGETAVSWQTFSNGAGAVPTIIGDADWGKMQLGISSEGRSKVYDFGLVSARTITLTSNRYGTGQGSATRQIRGQDTIFLQDDVAPAWEDYTTPIEKTWRFIQIRAIKNV